MISISQAVQSLASPRSLSSVQLSRTALLAATSPPAPSANLSLSTTLLAPLLYSASGLLTAASAAEATVPAPAVESPAIETTSSTNVAPPGITSNVPAVVASPTIAAVAENTASALDVTTSMPVSSVVDPEISALRDFTTNPVHGGLATALYINAAIYRMNQVSSASLVSAVDLPRPVTSLNAINVDITDLGHQSTERYR